MLIFESGKIIDVISPPVCSKCGNYEDVFEDRYYHNSCLGYTIVSALCYKCNYEFCPQDNVIIQFKEENNDNL
jgi:hypothetical protein